MLRVLLSKQQTLMKKSFTPSVFTSEAFPKTSLELLSSRTVCQKLAAPFALLLIGCAILLYTVTGCMQYEALWKFAVHHILL